MANTSADHVAAEINPYGVAYGTHAGLKGWIAQCACGAALRVNGGICHPPHVTISQLERHGWLIKKNKTPQCSNCQETKVAKPSPQIGPDPKIARKIYAQLDEHFDDVKRAYRGSASDEWVAKTLDVSVDIVTSIRIAAYGELAEDPKVSMLRDDIELLRMEFNDTVAKMQVDFNAKIGSLSARLPAKLSKAAG